MLKELLHFDSCDNNIKRNLALINTLNPINFSGVFFNVQISHLLEKVQKSISVNELAKLGDAFLWHHILILLSMSLPESEAQQEQILIHLFDNYYSYLPTDFQISIEAKTVFFPKLNLFLENDLEDTVILKKLSSGQCSLVTENAIDLHTPYLNAKKFGKINIIKLANDKISAALLTSFIPATEIQKICILTDGLYDKISKSLEIIKVVDPRLFSDIQNNIDYLIPLHLHENKTRNSFSTAELNGSIFISDGGNLLDFCEALIHEYYHNELNIYLQFNALFTSAHNNLYFSPWRTDLRPIGGLFHAIFVFVGVSLFYHKVLKENLYHESISAQLNAIMKKINLAFYQVRDEDLTEQGKELLLKLFVIFHDLAEAENIDLAPDAGLIEAMAVHPDKIKYQYPEFLLVEA